MSEIFTKTVMNIQLPTTECLKKENKRKKRERELESATNYSTTESFCCSLCKPELKIYIAAVFSHMTEWLKH